MVVKLQQPYQSKDMHSSETLEGLNYAMDPVAELALSKARVQSLLSALHYDSSATALQVRVSNTRTRHCSARFVYTR